MPITIGIFINPGVFPSVDGKKPRSNRSYEYDSLGDTYTRFLLEEILPEVGKQYKLTDKAEGRAIAGISSGGICAFTVAWERPDAFSKVISYVGSFTNIRGGHVYHALIRKTEKKPIRIFLQDGENDLDNLHGNWPLANREMAAALKFSGYDYRFEMGTEGHNAKHGQQFSPRCFVGPGETILASWLIRKVPSNGESTEVLDCWGNMLGTNHLAAFNCRCSRYGALGCTDGW